MSDFQPNTPVLIKQLKQIQAKLKERHLACAESPKAVVEHVNNER